MTTNGVTTRSKRKQEGVTPASDRPMKQRKSEPEPVEEDEDEMSIDGDMSPRPMNGVESEDEEGIKISGKVAAIAETKEWQATIERVVSTAVSIHFCQTCSFDTDPAMSSEATGFVVDAERGYILTNRHVVCSGPFWGYCIFDNHEECDVFPVYRDPVHDFGILRFDPKAIKYMKLNALTLRPDLAKVGSEIRVVGNDAGEKLSILSGVISRLDRNAPDYGEGYSDFNTNYIQAAAAASGGSSGSPVVDIDGFAVALQAGGRADGAATDYFLPLDRPSRALKCIQEGATITRGTIQTQWLIKPFDECRRLGLSSDWEAAMRKEFPKETGLLVAELILPEGPGHQRIEEGDVLIKVNGHLLTKFTLLDAILDDNVGGKVKFLVQRGGEDVEMELDVGDLHAITPDRFVSVAGGSFHDISYQQARMYGVAVKGVYVCEAAGSFRFEGAESGWIIDAVDNKSTPNLDTFITVMQSVPDRTRVIVSYKHLRDLHTNHTTVMLIDRHWSKKMRMAVRNDKTGLWDFSDIGDPLPAPAPVARSANFVKLDGTKYPQAADVIRSFVRVTVSMPVKLDGYPRSRKSGHGLVIDAEKGLVIISRAILPYDLCDVSVHIAESIIVDAKVVFLHPLQNYVIIQYDPSLVQAPIQSAKLATETIKQGAEAIFFGFNQNGRPVIAKTSVTDITTVGIPASASTPRYRAINLDAVTVDTSLAAQCGSGVLLSEDGTVQALWLTYLGERSSHSNKDIEYHLGLATPMLLPVLRQVQSGHLPNLRILNVETSTTTMSQARIMGLSDAWIERVQETDPSRHQLFIVRKVDSGHEHGLEEADILLTINDKLATRISDLDVMYTQPTLDVLVLRERQELRLSVATIPSAALETARAVIFCGAVLQPPHHAVRQQISKLHSGVYISGRMRGSPAYMYGLAPTNFITHVNAVPTPDLTAFVAEVNKIPDNTYFRLKVKTFDNVPWVATMKKNEHYFPTFEFQKDEKIPGGGEQGWKRVTYDEGGSGKKHEGVEPFEGEVVDQGMGAEAEVGGEVDVEV